MSRLLWTDARHRRHIRTIVAVRDSSSFEFLCNSNLNEILQLLRRAVTLFEACFTTFFYFSLLADGRTYYIMA